MERRYTPAGSLKVETRADGKPMIAGYAAVFYRENDPGTQFELRAGLVERIAPTAFNRALDERQDVRALFNHDANHVLGRSSAGTLRLSIDSRGLRYEVDLPDTQAGRDLAVSINRGDISQSSFGFNARKAPIAEVSRGLHVRTLEDVDLGDVSPVVFPAYESTSVGIRSLSDAKDAIEAFEAFQAEQFAAEKEKRARRLRMLDIS